MRHVLSLASLATIFLQQAFSYTFYHPVDRNLYYGPYAQPFDFHEYPPKAAQRKVALESTTENEFAVDSMIEEQKPEFRFLLSLPGLFVNSFRNVFDIWGNNLGAQRPLVALNGAFANAAAVTSTGSSTVILMSASTVYCASLDNFAKKNPPTCAVAGRQRRHLELAALENEELRIAPSVIAPLEPTALPTAGDNVKENLEPSIDETSSGRFGNRYARLMGSGFSASRASVIIAPDTVSTAAVFLGENLECIPPGIIVCP